MYEIEIEGKDKIFIPKHKDLLEYDEFSILFLWGGRFGAKTEDIARMLTFKCLMLPKFNCILSRKVFNTIKDSMYDTIKDFIYKKGLQSFFKFTTSPLKIECINGNKFLCRGFDKPEKIKSIKDPTHYWIEELAECDEKDFETALTTLRGIEHTQLIGTFNPETDEQLEKFWLYVNFFNRPEKNFNDIYKIELEDRAVEFKIKSIHTTYKDNPYVEDKQIAIVEKYRQDFERTKSTNSEYYYKIWTMGEWGDKLPDEPFLDKFSQIKHCAQLKYNEANALHIVSDINVLPYLPSQIYQFKDNKLHQIIELALEKPDNKTKVLAKKIIEYANKINYAGTIYIYGDRTAVKDDTNVEDGVNFFTIIQDEIKKYYHTEMRVPGIRSNKILDAKRGRKNPNVRNSGDFVNHLLETNRIIIDNNCIISIDDYKKTKKDPDGGICKKEKDKKTGGQKRGHFTDCLRYIACEILYDEYKIFSVGKRKLL